MKENQTGSDDPLQNDVSILIVDDNSIDRRMIAAACSQLDCHVDTAESGQTAIEKFTQTRHRLVITDYMMEPMNGLELATRLREIDPAVECILVSGSSNPEVMAYIQSNDLSPVITKPITPHALINRAILGIERFRGRKDVSGGVALSNRMDNCLPLIGHSEACQKLRGEVAELLPTNTPLLICGPVGSGKPQIATFLHQEGIYGHSMCLECFCGRESLEELSRSLISADGTLGEMIKLTKYGTLVIHNIEALPLDLQRALATKFAEITAKTHLIVLADASLDEALAEGTLDEGLYFKLSLNTLTVPCLGTRTEDIPEIASFILASPAQYGLSGNVSIDDLDAYLAFDPSGDFSRNLESLIVGLRRFSESRSSVDASLR